MRGRVDSEPEAGDSMPREKRNFLSLGQVRAYIPSGTLARLLRVEFG
jgi:hypothetical protein